ncbi:MAG: hypothetical protein ACMUIG_01010 [Thermoplasmatota archaeon]
MCLDASFKEKDGYFHATITGAISGDCTHPLSEKLVLYAAVTRLSKVLLDCRGIETAESSEEVLDFTLRTTETMNSYINAGRIGEMRFAYLLPDGLIESVQGDAGFDHDIGKEFMLTTDLEEAVSWLKSI